MCFMVKSRQYDKKNTAIHNIENAHLNDRTLDFSFPYSLLVEVKDEPTGNTIESILSGCTSAWNGSRIKET